MTTSPRDLRHRHQHLRLRHPGLYPFRLHRGIAETRRRMNPLSHPVLHLLPLSAVPCAVPCTVPSLTSRLLASCRTKMAKSSVLLSRLLNRFHSRLTHTTHLLSRDHSTHTRLRPCVVARAVYHNLLHIGRRCRMFPPLPRRSMRDRCRVDLARSEARTVTHLAQINDRWDQECIMRRARHRQIAIATATENGIVTAGGRAGGHAVVANGDSVCLLL